jgi:hypothetical protein
MSSEVETSFSLSLDMTFQLYFIWIFKKTLSAKYLKIIQILSWLLFKNIVQNNYTCFPNLLD